MANERFLDELIVEKLEFLTQLTIRNQQENRMAQQKLLDTLNKFKTDLSTAIARVQASLTGDDPDVDAAVSELSDMDTSVNALDPATIAAQGTQGSPMQGSQGLAQGAQPQGTQAIPGAAQGAKGMQGSGTEGPAQGGAQSAQSGAQSTASPANAAGAGPGGPGPGFGAGPGPGPGGAGPGFGGGPAGGGTGPGFGGGPTGGQQLTISPSNATLAVNGSQQFTASDATAKWSVDNQQIGSINPAGLFTGLSIGTCTVTATVATGPASSPPTPVGGTATAQVTVGSVAR